MTKTKNTDLQDAMWNRKKSALSLARANARLARVEERYSDLHSGMLSAYHTILTGKVNRLAKVYYGLLAYWHASRLIEHEKELNHNQLDILVSFLMGVRTKLPARLKSLWQKYFMSDDRLERLAYKGYFLASESKVAAPHQVALANLTYAYVLSLLQTNYDKILFFVDRALSFENLIKKETNIKYALRQLVRILRNAGKLYYIAGEKETGLTCLNRALALAKGEADTSDQVAKIQSVLYSLK